MLKYRREKLTLVFDLCIFGAITLQLLAFILARCLPVSSEVCMAFIQRQGYAV